MNGGSDRIVQIQVELNLRKKNRVDLLIIERNTML